MKMWWAEPRDGLKSLYFFVFPVYFGILDVPVHVLMTVDLNVKRHFGMSLRRLSPHSEFGGSPKEKRHLG